MSEITFALALNEALHEEMTRDKRVVMWGEDVAALGGVLRVTKGLLARFGEDRVKDTPISEVAIVGMAVGAALTGLRPVPEVMFVDFLGPAMDQIMNQMAKVRYMFGGQAKLPITLRAVSGAGLRAGPHHSQTLHSWFANLPGVKVVLPSTPKDAKGLLKAAIRDDNPVMFFEHKALYNMKGEVPDGEFIVPLCKADVKRVGEDVTIVATQMMVHKSLEAARCLEQKGISAEVVDPRTLVPLDKETIVESVKKTHRAVVVDESNLTGGIQGEFVSIIVEEAFDYLDAPIKRLGVPDVPIPQSPVLEDYVLPNAQDIVEAVLSLF